MRVRGEPAIRGIFVHISDALCSLGVDRGDRGAYCGTKWYEVGGRVPKRGPGGATRRCPEQILTERAAMFLGETSHSLDVKGRLVLPARFRDQLKVVFITSEIDKCLALWPPDEFNVKASQMRALLRGNQQDRKIGRAFFAGAQEGSPDRQGRLPIPSSLRSFAGLDRDVMVVGQYDHLEVWDAAAWVVTKREGDQGLAEGEPQGLSSPSDGNDR